MEKIRVSIDFDGTLTRRSVRRYVKSLIKRGIEVWIVTRRYDHINKYDEIFCRRYNIINISKEFKRLHSIAKRLGVKASNIVYTNMKPKGDFFSTTKVPFVFHLDDDPEDIKSVSSKSKVIAIQVGDGHDWKKNCENALSIYKFNKMG